MSLRRFYSQAGQDRWVAEQVFNYKTSGFFLEVGSFDGILLSNTLWLERHLGWTGICIEADPGTFDLLKKNRKCTCVNACVGRDGKDVEFALGRGPYSGQLSDTSAQKDSARHFSTLRSVALGTILRQNNAPSTIDYLSLDVEGMEEEVMGTFPFEDYRFRCATIERPNEALRAVLRDQGYLLVVDHPGLDAFYLHPEMHASYLGRVMTRAEYASLSLPRRILKSCSLFSELGLRSWLRRV